MTLISRCLFSRISSGRKQLTHGLEQPLARHLPMKLVLLPCMKSQCQPRLQMLEQQVVGGERTSSKQGPEGKAQTPEYADEQRLQLVAALQESNQDSSEQALLNGYDSIQEEVRAKSKMLEKVQEKLWAAQTEIKDLQLEFGLEKMDYLSTIQCQERDLMLCQQLLDQVQSLVQRDCNYSNLEKIRPESVWDEESGCWKISEPDIQKTHLPAAVPAPPQPKPARTSPSNESGEPAAGAGQERQRDHRQKLLRIPASRPDPAPRPSSRRLRGGCEQRLHHPPAPTLPPAVPRLGCHRRHQAQEGQRRLRQRPLRQRPLRSGKAAAFVPPRCPRAEGGRALPPPSLLPRAAAFALRPGAAELSVADWLEAARRWR